MQAVFYDASIGMLVRKDFRWKVGLKRFYGQAGIAPSSNIACMSGYDTRACRTVSMFPHLHATIKTVVHIETEMLTAAATHNL